MSHRECKVVGDVGIDDSYQRIYFYYQVNRGKNLVLGADTPSAAPTTAGTATPGPGEDEGGQEDEEDEHDARGVRVRHQRSWEAQQEKLVEEGKRPPIDRSYVNFSHPT